MSSDDRTGPLVDRGAEPWISYDAQEPAKIAAFVAKSSPSQAQAVRTYERSHSDRAEVIAAVDRRLAKWNACAEPRA